jgi:hypothetical protein
MSSIRCISLELRIVLNIPGCLLMTTSVFYRAPWLYEGLMRVLYRGRYNARSEALAALVPERSIVVDLRCGSATLYFKYLRFKQVSYTGLDINRAFCRTALLLRLGEGGEPSTGWHNIGC